MEEIKERQTTESTSTAPEEMYLGVASSKMNEKKDKETAEPQVERGEQPKIGPEDTTMNGVASEKNTKNCNRMHCIIEGVLAVAVIVLFILHFCGGKKESTPVAAAVGTPGTGEVIYVNIDSVNEHYEMVSLLTDSLDAEKQKQTIVFQNRQKALENKLANYQRNMQSGSLTPQQAQYAEASLQQESQQLQSDYAATLENLEARYTAALAQITDSVKASVSRVNAKRNASFVLSYGANGPVICADPSKDITREVLEDLNKPFSKKKKNK